MWLHMETHKRCLEGEMLSTDKILIMARRVWGTPVKSAKARPRPVRAGRWGVNLKAVLLKSKS